MGRGRGRAGFKFKVKASKAPPSEQAASFDELVTQAVQPGRRKTRSSARANAPAASVPAARASGRKRKPASPPAATSPSRGKRPRRGQAAADLPAPSASPDSRREARKRAPATASKAPAYAAAPPDSVRLPHARYGNAAALHKLVDAAIDAELRASEVTYGDSHSYILATLAKVGSVFKEAVAASMIASIKTRQNDAPHKPNPANAQLRQREKELSLALQQFRDEQAQWRRAAKTYAARFPTAHTKRSKRVSQTPALAANLPRIAMAAIDEFDVGVSQMAAAVRIGDATLRRGVGATTELSARFYSESFRNVPNHEQPAATVRSFGGRAASTANYGVNDTSPAPSRRASASSTPREKRASAAASSRRMSGASARSRRKSTS